MSFINKLPIIALSPMDGITDEAFRLLQVQIAKPDLMFTEFVSAEGISHGGVKLYDTLLFSNQEHPIIGQLFGKNPDSFYKSAIILSELGFDGIDINMGCPAKTVTQNGSGAALISKPDLAVEIIKKTKQGINDWFENKIKITDLGLNQKTLNVINRNKKYSEINISPFVKGRCPEGTERIRPTISVKTRLGIDKSIIDSWATILLAQDLDFLTIHARTLKQGYAGTADWSEIQNVVELAKNTNTKILGNGDIESKSQALEFCEKYGVDGVLIGRAACGNPWCFKDYIATPKERFSAMLLHAQFFKEVFPNRRFDSLRKNFLFYASGLVNAKQLRSKLVRLNSIEDLLQLEGDFLS
ncbi:MAG: tRNA-dihydrouridine synthase [Candidatus Shapirobacteria bacterium]|nr:tRNA-dihydrouridine synthase [Candidatus Shapirobacteria bacterium]MDD4410629.1 tRNA-dihydrouridine synthase [Candidatus Shapirobacteria bacterium]